MGTPTRMGNNYRVLVPYLNEIPITILDSLIPYEYAFVISYSVFELIAIFIITAGIFYFLRIWYSPEQSLIGMILMSVSLTTTMTFSFTFHPWSFAEGAILIIGMYMIYYNKFSFVIITSVLAVMNRPTGAILPMAYVFTNLDPIQLTKSGIFNQSQKLKKFVVLFFITIIPFIYLQFIRSANSYDSEFVINNILNRYAPVYGQDWLASLFALFAFLGLLWFFVIIGYPTLPKFIKRASLVLLFYLPLIILTGDPTELRLLIPLYPFVIPAILNVIIADELLPLSYSERAIRYISISGIVSSLVILSLVVVTSPETVTTLFDSYIDGGIKSSWILEINLFRVFWGFIGGFIIAISLWVYYNRSELISPD
jgi:hypothetical protein